MATTVYMTTNGRIEYSLQGSKDTMMTPALVPFGASVSSSNHWDKSVLGGKGSGLQEMSSLGIAVPPGFTLTTPLCATFDRTEDFPADLWLHVETHISRLEQEMGRKFGDVANPLLLSCRSGAAISMPGMMDTVLNVVRQGVYVVPSTVACRLNVFLLKLAVSRD